jgi:hypothetical protein
MTQTPDTDRFFTIPELIERWPIGRTKTYEVVRMPDFPPALVLLFDRNGRLTFPPRAGHIVYAAWSWR